MRFLPALSPALAFAGAALLPVPAAGAAGGGTPAPSTTGGARYGSVLKRDVVRPVVRELSVTPRRVTAGRLPRVVVRIDERGTRRVRARVVVLRLPGREPVARIALGWIQTGRRLAVGWPAGLALGPGRYLVRVHARDRHNHVLRRRARSSGRRVLTVRVAPRPAPRPVPPPAPAPPAGPAPVPPASAPVVSGGVFPLTGPHGLGGADSRFGAARTGHRHEGHDIDAATGTPVVAPFAGTVSWRGYQSGGAGHYLVLAGVDGRHHFFAHCRGGSVTLRTGTPVAAAQPVCAVGNSGSATGPHLHYEIWVGGWRPAGGRPIDPLPDLLAWRGR